MTKFHEYLMYCSIKKGTEVFVHMFCAKDQYLQRINMCFEGALDQIIEAFVLCSFTFNVRDVFLPPSLLWNCISFAEIFSKIHFGSACIVIIYGVCKCGLNVMFSLRTI